MSVFSGGGLWSNRWRMRLQTQPVYGENGAIIGYFYRNGANLEFRFVETVAPGGGAVRYGRTGITTVNDAGAAGRPVVAYNPTNNDVLFGTLATGGLQFSTGTGTTLGYSATQNILTAAGYNIDVAGVQLLVATAALANIRLPQLNESWLLVKGVHSCRERGDAPPITEIPGAGGSIAWINGRGGLKRLTAVIAGAETYEHNNACDWISLQDAPRLYSRWTAQQWNAGVPDSFQAVGWRDWANTNCVWFQWDAAVVGGTITIRANRAGATTIHDTGVAAVAGQFHVCELISTAAGVITCYIDGTLVHTLAAAEVPVVTTLMEEWKYSACVAPAILSELDYDVVYTVLSRNTGVAP